MKYNSLINKRIVLSFCGQPLNAYKLTAINATDRFMAGLEGQGRIYSCDADWENKDIDGALPVMDFDEETLDALLSNGQANAPFMRELVFKIENE